MYGTTVGVTAGAAATLPFTGAVGLGWEVLAGVTLLAVGAAILRLVPRRQH